MDDYNPYAAPKAPIVANPLAAESEEGRGVWRDGKVLVMAKPARLPSYCVKCNEPATTRLKRSLSWHPQLVFLLVLISPLIYIIVALVIRKTAKIEVPLCERHRAGRVRGIWIAWLVCLTGIAFLIVGGANAGPSGNENLALLVFVGIVMLLGGLIYATNLPPVMPKKIDQTHIWLTKVSPLYLAYLPELPNFASKAKGKGKGRTDELGLA